MNKEEEEKINDLYEQLLDEYKDYKEEMTTVSKARKTFAMDVHEQMKQKQIEKILEELGDVVTKLNVTKLNETNDDSSEDRMKLREKFYDLIEEFNEVGEFSYGGSGKKKDKTKKSKTKKYSLKTKRTPNKTKRSSLKTKRTMRKIKRISHK